jgi:SRSO17 transposase
MAQKSSEIGTAYRLEQFFDGLGKHLKDRRKKESFAMYAFGILGDGERKSAEPIAARACGDESRMAAMHQKLIYFLGHSRWDDRAVRMEAARQAIDAVQEREPITTWIIDDTGFLKQGTHSVGVQRQYTGSAGKITNCQIGVSLAVASNSEQIAVDFELYLPASWTDNRARRREARIPDDVQFTTKPELALDMMRRAKEQGIPGDILLADSAYGDSTDFRNGARALGLDFAVGVHHTLGVVRLDRNDRINTKPQSAGEVVAALPKKTFRNVTWRDGTKGKLSGRFCFVRVQTTHDDGIALALRERLWLVAEWPEGDDKPSKFVLTTLPRRMSKKQIVRLLKERWRTERMYEDLKGELGLDHFEGRSFPGWHHHVSVVLSCYAFVVAERARGFPPSASRARRHRTLSVAA